MNKARIDIGYAKLIMDMDDAMKLFALLNKDTIYAHDTHYVKDEAGKSKSIGYLKKFNDSVSLCGVAPEDYAMWKLAGEANDE